MAAKILKGKTPLLGSAMEKKYARHARSLKARKKDPKAFEEFIKNSVKRRSKRRWNRIIPNPPGE